MIVAYKQYDKKRSSSSHMLGSTIFVSQYPKFWNLYHGKYSMLILKFSNKWKSKNQL